MTDEMEQLKQRQVDADQALEFLNSKQVPNLDIQRPGTHKVTLVELLAEFARKQSEAKMKALASATRKVLPAPLLQELIDHFNPLDAFLREMK